MFVLDMAWVQLGHFSRVNKPVLKDVISFPRVDEIDKNHFCIWLFLFSEASLIQFHLHQFFSSKTSANEMTFESKEECHNLLEKLDRFSENSNIKLGL